MPSASCRFRWLAIGLLGGCMTSVTLPLFHSPQSLTNIAVSAPRPPAYLSQSDPPPDPVWGGPGGSQATDQPPELDWGEPGGSQLVRDMADDLVEFYQWGEPGGSRLGSVCPIAPYSEELELLHGPLEVWSDRPLIIWQNRGNQPARRVVLDDLGIELSNQTVEPTDFMVRYDGEPLQSGQFYDLVFLNENGGELIRYSFSTLPAADRDAVSAELAQLEAQLMANGTTTEELALWRSRFFIQAGLLYDGLDALFSVENPSPELAQRQQALLTSLCASDAQE